MRVAARLLLGLCMLGSRPAATPAVDYEVLAVYPHDPDAYTQGLVFEDTRLYESTGLRGHSSLREVDLASGEVVRRFDLLPGYFGEGITIFGTRIIQLTWESGLGFVYDLEGFRPVATFSYPTEGWGLTHDGTHLVMSDGSANLYFVDPVTFDRVRTLRVTDGTRPVDRLNELEYVEGLVYANVYQSAWIALIDPVSGQLVDTLDLIRLVEAETTLSNKAEALNGIAYDRAGSRLLVTGKNWRRLYALRLSPPPGQIGVALE